MNKLLLIKIKRISILRNNRKLNAGGSGEMAKPGSPRRTKRRKRLDLNSTGS